MKLLELRVRDFRNLTALHLEADPRFNVITGRNGQGKTNLVESIHVLSTLRSFRSLRNRELLRDDTTEAIVEADVFREGSEQHLLVRIRPHGKRAEVNGNTVRDLQRYFGRMNTVVFTPEDTGVLRASPADRRLFLDRMVFNAKPAYALDHAAYEDVLRNRNAVLKQDRPDHALLDVYDEQLARLGAAIAYERSAWLDTIGPRFATRFRQLFGDTHLASTGYLRAWDRDDDEDVAPGDVPSEALQPTLLEEQLLNALRRTRTHDMRRGFTQTGPHRDDWAGTLDGGDMRTRGSQGQHRAFLLALKITEIETLHDRFGEPPILLLDDVSSELDPERNERLFGFLHRFDGQAFLTTTDLRHVPLSSGFRHWQMDNGQLHG